MCLDAKQQRLFGQGNCRRGGWRKGRAHPLAHACRRFSLTFFDRVQNPLRSAPPAHIL